MEKRYSRMTEFELTQEIRQLNEQARKAEQMGRLNELAVFERKILMAKAYLLNPEDFKPDEIYEIEQDPGTFFKIKYMNGIFAWGTKLTGEERVDALPISMLKKTEARK
ncbi:YfhH family protein [Bacillus sp. AK128]